MRIINISELFSFLHICEIPSIAKLISVVVTVINIIRIAVPIILIITIMIDLARCVIKNEEFDNVKKGVVAKIVAALLVFFIPMFVNLIAYIAGKGNIVKECMELSNNPVVIEPSEPDKPSGDTYVASVKSNGALITVSAKSNNKIVSYLVTSDSKKPNGNEDNWIDNDKGTFEVAKLPGTYHVYVKDSKGNISEGKTITITLEQLYNEGPKSRLGGKNQLTTQIDQFLKSKSDSIENYDNFIATSVVSEGLFTGRGVLTAALASITYLYKYGAQIPYISNISCTATRYNEKFGINPRWGILIAPIGSSKAKECKGSYVGFDCASYVGWSIHNGGFKAENTAGSYLGTNKAKQISTCTGWDEKKKCSKFKSREKAYEMYDMLEIGDIIYSNQHVMFYLGHIDSDHNGKNDAIYVAEGASPVGLHIFTYNELYANGGYSSYYAINKMEGYYSNQSNYACLNGNKVPAAYEKYSSLFRASCK